jgi:hypothetical protein
MIVVLKQLGHPDRPISELFYGAHAKDMLLPASNLP